MNFIDKCINANVKILNIIKESDGSLFEDCGDGHGGDISKKIDIIAENIFVEELSPFGTIYSEESGIIGNNSGMIVIDPIDGSENLSGGIPYYGTSVSYSKDNYRCSIITNLANGDIFIKENSNYSERNLYSTNQNLIFNAKFGIFEKAYSSCDLANKLCQNNLKYRSPGALAISFAYCRRVNFLLFSGKIRDFDIEAGLHICDDLDIYRGDNILLVSKSKEYFNKILHIIGV